jgi:hypothetical protein
MRDINLHIAQANLYGADVVGVSDYVERDARAHHDPATELGEALVPRMLGRPRCYFLVGIDVGRVDAVRAPEKRQAPRSHGARCQGEDRDGRALAGHRAAVVPLAAKATA